MSDYKINQELEPVQIEVDKYRSYYYAGASGDFNPIHLDNDFAIKVGLPGKILHGLCTMAFVYRTVMKNNDPDKMKKLSVRFRQVVRPSDKLTIKGKVIEKENDTVKIGLIAENQNNEQVITNGCAVIVVGT